MIETDSKIKEAAFNPAAYGDACADFYDEIYGPVSRPVVDTLLELAGSGRVLELGSATGRLALALRSAGLQHYVGVESSKVMIKAMRAKPAGRAIDVVHGDFAECSLPGRYDMIFALLSTFQLLPSIEKQTAALKNLAAHLNPGGLVLLECFDALHEQDRGTVRRSTHRIQTSAGWREYPVVEFFSTADAIDAMANGVGLQRAARWSDWRRRAHQPGEPRHISLYRLPKS